MVLTARFHLVFNIALEMVPVLKMVLAHAILVGLAPIAQSLLVPTTAALR